LEPPGLLWSEIYIYLTAQIVNNKGRQYVSDILLTICMLSVLPVAGAHPEFFLGGTDPEAIYNLVDFKNSVIKIMP
jgi:hypothetical protein